MLRETMLEREKRNFIGKERKRKRLKQNEEKKYVRQRPGLSSRRIPTVDGKRGEGGATTVL